MITLTRPPTAENLVLFVHALRSSGLPVSVQQTLDLGRGLALIDLSCRAELFHAARATLITRREDLALYRLLFDAFWGGGRQAPAAQNPPPAPRHDPVRQRGRELLSLMARRAQPQDPEIETSDRSETYSDVELLQCKDFALLSAEELDNVRRLLELSTWQVSLRRTRRRQRDRFGDRLDVGRLLRQAAKCGGRILVLPRRSRKIRPRPLVLIADVSGSMERYSRLVLLFFHSLCHALQDSETFTFGTRLSRITSSLRLRDVDRALYEIGAEVTDWAGGTRISDSLGTFNRRWSRRVLRRGAVVLIVSDGWERGETEVLRAEMRHLRDRCHRLIWLNPRLGHPHYQPLVEGMAAALPFVDDFLPIHNLQSLAQLAEHLASLPHRRSARRSIPTGALHSPRRTPLNKEAS